MPENMAPSGMQKAMIVTAVTVLLVSQLTRAQFETNSEFALDEIECAGERNPILHQREVPWGTPGRAWMTTPPEIEIKQSNIPNAGLGTFARTFLPVNTWLGEYEGEVWTEEPRNPAYCWLVARNDTYIINVDALAWETSNWLRWVNSPRNREEENVAATTCYTKIMYVVSKPVYPGQELMVYYGHNYAEYLGTDITLFGGKKKSNTETDKSESGSSDANTNITESPPNDVTINKPETESSDVKSHVLDSPSDQ